MEKGPGSQPLALGMDVLVWQSYAAALKDRCRISASVHCRRMTLLPQVLMLPAMIRPPTMAKSAKLSTIPTAAKHLPKISGFFVEA